jgi:hypothetical protein
MRLIGIGKRLGARERTGEDWQGNERPTRERELITPRKTSVGREAESVFRD